MIFSILSLSRYLLFCHLFDILLQTVFPLGPNRSLIDAQLQYNRASLTLQEGLYEHVRETRLKGECYRVRKL